MCMMAHLLLSPPPLLQATTVTAGLVSTQCHRQGMAGFRVWPPRTLVGRAIPSGVQPSSLYACLLNAIQVAPGLGHSLIYISLINDIQHLFRCLFAIYLSLVKCKFKGLLPLFYLGACLYNSRNYRIIGF